MHHTQKNLIEIKEKIKNKINNLGLSNYDPKVIAVSKTFSERDILPLVGHGHFDFGENKVQEAQRKWTKIKENHKGLKLHMLGKLQTNKVKNAVEIFDYIHSLDNLKLANKISKEEQKSGIDPSDIVSFYEHCLELKLNIIGTMCIPPDNQDPKPFFENLLKLNQKLNLTEISMGMTNDYLDALQYKSTFLRIGTGIFGKRIKEF